MYYILNKETNHIDASYVDLKYAKQHLSNDSLEDEKYKILEDMDMKLIGRTVSVDGTVVYNNIDYWMNTASDVLNDYDSHVVLDILGTPVSESRFTTELHENISRMCLIDGRPGQIDFNMEVGKEFVSLFREECILTKFTKESDTSPMIIFEKLTPVIAMLDAGAFREAKQYLAGYREKIKDDFLTDERIDKYIAMLNAADAIEYATDEDYFYVVPGEEDAN